MMAVALRAVEVNSNYMSLAIVVFALAYSLVWIYLIWLFANDLTKEQRVEGLRILREFTEHGPKISSWLKEHKEELQRWPIATLNNQEFVDLINRDQELYERVLDIYPDCSDTVTPPKEFRQYLIELAQGQHRQTH